MQRPRGAHDFLATPYRVEPQAWPANSASTAPSQVAQRVPSPASENPPFSLQYDWPNDASITNYPNHDKINKQW